MKEVFENQTVKVMEKEGTDFCAVIINKKRMSINIYNELTGFDYEIEPEGWVGILDDGYGRATVEQFQKEELEPFGEYNERGLYQYNLFYDDADEEAVMRYMDELEGKG